MTAVTTNPEISKFLNTLEAPQREILTAVRNILFQVDENIEEVLHWGSIKFIRFGQVCLVRVLSKRVVLDFFQGTGARTRSIKLRFQEDLKPEPLKMLVKQAIDINRKHLAWAEHTADSMRQRLPRGRPVWFVNLIKKYFPDRFRIARLTHMPVIKSMIDGLLFKGDDTIYLPKDQVIQVNRSVSVQEEMVLPSAAVEHFVKKARHIWIMDTCFCRDADNCSDYPHDLGCIFLGEAVLKMNPRLGRLAGREEALNHLRKSREAGLVHMIGKNRIDQFWTGAGPEGKLFSICNCCPCCCLWRVVPHLGPDSSANVHKMPGVAVNVTERCIGCGTCAESTCFLDAIHMENGKATIDEKCAGCGRCVEACPSGAIELKVLDQSFVQQTIARMEQLIDVT
jgi:ferredoxin